MITAADAWTLIIPILRRAPVSQLEAMAIELAAQRIQLAVDAYKEPEPT